MEKQQETNEAPEEEFSEKLVKIKRVSKVLKGGRRFSFSALVIVGNKMGTVGVGFGKANDVSEAIRKSVQDAKKQLVSMSRYKSTIPHWVKGKYNKSVVLLKPAAAGAGIIAGAAVRIILEMAGISDVLSKSFGSRNPSNMARATFDAISQLQNAKQQAQKRNVPLEKFWS